MATVVMMTGKGVGGLAYALQSSEWLEFNMVQKTNLCVPTGNNCAPSLHFFFYIFCGFKLVNVVNE